MISSEVKMSEIDEEVYSTIFKALRHGVRRKILRMLSTEPLSFSYMADILGISSSHLTYHLETLGELVSKTEDAKYTLSIFGRAAVNMINSVEDTPKQALRMGGERCFKIITVILLAVVIVSSGLSLNLFYQNKERKFELDEQKEELTILTEKHERIAWLTELVNLSLKRPIAQKSSGVYIVSGYNLHYGRTRTGQEYGRQVAVFYSPQDNLTLELRTWFFLVPGPVPLTVQKGNAFLKESGVFVEQLGDITYWQSPILWSIEINETDTNGTDAVVSRVYKAHLPTKGWYTLSLTGPIKKSSGGAIIHKCIEGWWENRTDIWSFNLLVNFKVLKNENPILFAVEARYWL